MILCLSDIDDPFAPLPFLNLSLNLKIDRDRIDAFLDKLLALYYCDSRKNLPISTCTGSALSACEKLLKTDGGKVLLFSSTICSKGLG